MQLQNILTLERTVSGASASSKKRVLETIAEHICKDVSAFDNEELFRRLNAREKLGSTGIGNGIAIPHCRVPNCLGITGALFTLDTNKFTQFVICQLGGVDGEIGNIGDRLQNHSLVFNRLLQCSMTVA